MDTINARRYPTPTDGSDARVLPLRRGPAVAVLPEGDLERVRSSALLVLEETGVDLGSEVISARLGAAGARTDDGGSRVRIPAPLVEETLPLAPRALVLAGRDPGCDLLVDGTEGWLGAGGPAERAFDLATDEPRALALADVVDAARLADAVPQIGFVREPGPALDVPQGPRRLRELHALVASTSKHVQVGVPARAGDAAALVEIARLAAGDDGALRDRPVLSAVLSTSALALDGVALEAAVELARHAIPVGFVATPTAGATAPATVAGALVTAAAEVLAGVVALQLLVPGAPTFIGAQGLKAGTDEDQAVSGGTHDLLFQMAWVQLARRLGVPSYRCAFPTGSTTSDWQAGMEGGLAATTCWMTGPDLLAGAGLRRGGRIFSPVAMLLDTELFDLIRQVPLGFAADEEALALEVIEKVGPGEHFLGERHTLRHMREAWKSRFMDTDTWEAWEEKGRAEPPDHARERALEILASHEPMPLPTAADERIREVIEEHDPGRG